MLYTYLGPVSSILIIGVFAIFGFYISQRLNHSPKAVPIFIFLVLLGGVVTWIDGINDPRFIAEQAMQSTEIIKFYANGTGLLSNGTLVNLKGVFGCG